MHIDMVCYAFLQSGEDIKSLNNRYPNHVHHWKDQIMEMVAEIVHELGEMQ